MKKCHANELPALVVSLVVQCNKGVQFNLEKYLCENFWMIVEGEGGRKRIPLCVAAIVDHINILEGARGFPVPHQGSRVALGSQICLTMGNKGPCHYH